jgi:glycosyltransferase involved in cell wall biosynthesis
MRRMGTTCSVAPARANSSAIGDGAGTAMWQSQPSSARLRTIRASAWSDPPRSATGWMKRITLVRVAINVEQLLYRAPGGIGRYTAKLVTLLPDLFPEDTVVPFTARHGEEEVRRAYRQFGIDPEHRPGPRSGPVPLPVRLPLPRPVLYDGWHLAGLPRLNWLSSALGAVDLIHAPSVAVPAPGRARLVVTVHDVAAELFPETFPPRGRWFHARGVRAAARRADLVITVSEAAAAEIRDHTPIRPDRLRVVPNGVDATAATPEDVERTLARFGLAGAPYVFWLGSLEPRKNVGVLISAFARLVAARPELPHRLVLAGPSGWRQAGLVPEMQRPGLGDRLRLLGPVSYEQLPGLYAGAALLAFPSRHEGFGLPVLEAMVQGTPVACADIPALREVAGGAARLVPPMDVDAWVATLDELLDDDRSRQKMAAAGRVRAAGFSWERTVRATHAVYEEALA